MGIKDYNEPVAENISKIIGESGLKQHFVASKAGFTAHEFNAMLNGRKLIKICDIPRISAALGVDTNALFKKVGD